MASLDYLSESDSCNLIVDSESGLEDSFVETRPDSFLSEIDSTNSLFSSPSFSTFNKENTIYGSASPIATRLFPHNIKSETPTSSNSFPGDDDFGQILSDFLNPLEPPTKKICELLFTTFSIDCLNESEIKQIQSSMSDLVCVKEKIQREFKNETFSERKISILKELENQISAMILFVQEKESEKQKAIELSPRTTLPPDEDYQTDQTENSTDDDEHENEEQEENQNDSDETEEETGPILSLTELLARIGGSSSEDEQRQKSGRNLADNSSQNSQHTNFSSIPLTEGQNVSNLPFQGITCSICFESNIPNTESYTLADCCHSYCLECLRKYFKVKVDSGQVLSISCPDVNCSLTISDNDVKGVLNGEDFSRYQHFYRLAKLRSHPDCRWCPRPNCDTYMIALQTSPQFPCLTCTSCSTKFCYLCHEEWHPKRNCKQHRKRLEKRGKISSKDELWKKEHNTKKCPRCKIDIEKLVGCNHIICGVCNFQFCWLCLEQYSEDHYSTGPCANKCFDIGDLVEGGEGLLFPDDDDSDTSRWKKVKRGGKYVFYVTLISITAPVVLSLAIPVITVAGPVYGGYKLGKYVKKKRKS